MKGHKHLSILVAMAYLSGTVMFTTPATAGTKDFAIRGYAMPADKPVTIVMMRPDVEVGLLQGGGVPEPNADWTAAARANLAAALDANQKQRGTTFRVLDPQTAEAQQLVSDYDGLHRAVAGSILEFVYGAKLPTKKGKGGDYVFDWTLGPGTSKIGEIGGGNYGLFVFARDNFASDQRKAMQALGMLGCIVGACVIVTGGQHIAYASLVELSTGNIVWFNVLRGSKGDIREAEGAQAMVDAIMASMPVSAVSAVQEAAVTTGGGR